MGGMKKLSKKLTYDAPAEAVAAMLDDPAFRESVLERQRVHDALANHEVLELAQPIGGG